MFKCENCGGELIYSIKDKKLKCQACKSLYEIDDMLDSEEENAETIDMNVFTCPSCGGEVYSTSSTAASFCSFCGSHVTLTQKMVQWRKPEYVIPFIVTKDRAKELVAKKLSGKPFIPSELKNPANLTVCRGIYIPYWVYETRSTTDMRMDCESISGNTHSVYRITGTANEVNVGLNHDASDSFADDIGNNLNPYELKDAKNFTSAYLCGFFADIADRESDAYEKDVKQSANQLLYADVKRYIRNEYPMLDTIGTPSGATTKVTNASLCLFPIWLVSYKKEDSVAYLAVNGTTEKVVTDTPVDKKKFYITASILAVLLSILLYKINFSTAHCLLYPMGIFTLINMSGLMMGTTQMLEKENTTEKVVDVGSVVVNGKEKKVLKGTKKSNSFTLILLLVSILGFFLGYKDIPSDAFYYGYAALEIGLNLVGLLDGIKHLNLITARKLPQFDYKGKDVVS